MQYQCFHNDNGDIENWQFVQSLRTRQQEDQKYVETMDST